MKNRSEREVLAARRKMHGEDLTTATKKCHGHCGKTLRLDDYHACARYRDGLATQCRTCGNMTGREQGKRHLDRSDEEILDSRKRMRPNAVKRCGGCKEQMSIDRFYTSRSEPDGLTKRCKTCIDRENGIIYDATREVRMNAKKAGCAVCGETDLDCLEFAHLPGKEKLKKRNGKGLTVRPSLIATPDVLLAELEICRILCSVCHADETHAMEQANLSQLDSAIRTRQQRAEKRAVVDKEKRRRGECVDCHKAVEEDFWRFDFDHVRDEKVMCVSTMAYNSSHPIEDVEAEMDKCDLRCKNCHRRVTAKRRRAAAEQLKRGATTKPKPVVAKPPTFMLDGAMATPASFLAAFAPPKPTPVPKPNSNHTATPQTVPATIV
jgi:hypothetical protein